MTATEFFQRLCTIDREAQSLVSEAGYSFDYGFDVLPRHDPDERFILDVLTAPLESLSPLHEELLYLMKPISGEYTLERLPDGRFGYHSFPDGFLHRLVIGDTFEAKVPDCFGVPHWVRTTFDADMDGNLFLWGCGSVPLDHLTIRVRG